MSRTDPITARALIFFALIWVAPGLALAGLVVGLLYLAGVYP